MKWLDKLFKRPVRAIDLAAAGDDWTTAAIIHDGVPGVLHLRRLPPQFERSRLGCVALAWSDAPLAREAMDDATRTLQAVVEGGGQVLLVGSHWQADRSTWYAYAATSDALDVAMTAAREQQPLGWGINADADWAEYDNMLRLADQAAPAG